jgi:hypothetical protein
LIFSLFFLSGCGSKSTTSSNKCTFDEDCSHLTCALCVSGECRAREKPDCCGNRKCDGNYNECTCPADCGECKSNVDYMIKECDTNNQCVSTINLDSAIKDSKSLEVKLGNNVLRVTPSFHTPFILGTSQLNLNIKADQLDDKTTILIKRIRVYDKINRATKITIAERDLNQELYTINSEIDEDFVLIIERNNTNIDRVLEATKSLAIEVIYDRKSIDTLGRPQVSSSSFERDIATNLKFIIMPTSECNPLECNDGNSCTKNECKFINGYNYCVYEYVTTPCCGNKVCDPGEDKCSCPIDCGECDFVYGSYVEYACNTQNRCMPKIIDGKLEEISKIFTTSSLPHFRYEIKTFFKQPFNIKDDLTVEMKLLDLNSLVISAELQSIQIIESTDNLLGELVVNEAISDVGDIKTYRIKPSRLSMSDSERKLRPRLIFNFRYVIDDGVDRDGNPKTKTELRKETLNLDEIYFVNI